MHLNKTHSQKQNKMQNEINRALEILQQGKILLYPTDTVWGLGCDATNADAVKRIYEIKKRPDSKSMIILVSNFLMLQQYVTEVPFKAVELMEETAAPLTVIYPKARNLASNLIPNDGSIGIRIPNDEFCRELISAFGKPIVSTSANISGMKSSSLWEQVNDYIKESVDYATTWRRDDTKIAKPSTIVKVHPDGTITKLR